MYCRQYGLCTSMNVMWVCIAASTYVGQYGLWQYICVAVWIVPVRIVPVRTVPVLCICVSVRQWGGETLGWLDTGDAETRVLRIWGGKTLGW